MKDDFLDDLYSLQRQGSFFRLLANTFAQLAKTRLTEKQRFLLHASRYAIQYHPSLSPTALADYLARKFQLPLSTTKFNLKVLINAGLLEINSPRKCRTTIRLSFGGHLLTQLLPKPD
ncbi:MAG: hypothetical protein ACFFCF_02025 [Promethearchaeota archaeon]